MRPTAVRTHSRAVLVAALACALSACGFVGFPGVYKIDVEQGNLVMQDMVDQLQPGMSKRQVRFIMGSSLAEDTFNPDRWEYPYVIRNGQDVIRQAQVVMLFENDRLVEIRGDYLPEWARPAGEADAQAETVQDDDTGAKAP
jgi:outer membrane protein assembly factor BamE